MRTLVGALVGAATLTTVALHPATVAGQATMAPTVCTSYERAIVAASADHGQAIRLACVLALDV